MRVLKRVWPWLIATALLAVIIWRIPYSAFQDAITTGPHLSLLIVDVIIVIITLFTDAVAVWASLSAVHMARPFTQVFAVRGATFVLFIINYTLGQSSFGYYLNRTGATPLRATGATLFLIGTNFAALLVVTTIACAVGSYKPPQLWWILMIGCGAFIAYLLAIQMRPAPLAHRELLAPLFEGGVRGHLVAVGVRTPHVVVMSIGTWAALRAWGIPAPGSSALTLIPIVVLASALPIAPAGLGTTQAALVLLFTPFARGGKAEVLAFSIVHFVYNVGAMLAVGLLCMPLARRIGAPGLTSAESAA